MTESALAKTAVALDWQLAQNRAGRVQGAWHCAVLAAAEVRSSTKSPLADQKRGLPAGG